MTYNFWATGGVDEKSGVVMYSRCIRGARQHRGKSADAIGQSVDRVRFSIEQLEERRLLSAGIPTAPTGFSAANGATPTDVVLNWNTVSGATSYQVWRNTSATTTSATDIAPSVSSATFDDTSVIVGTTYFYWVVASNGGGNSGFSTIASATGGTLVWGDTFGTNGYSSAWGAFNATDPNNTNVIYTNTMPAQATTKNPTTLQILSDPQATNGQALALSLMPAPTGGGKYDSAEISTEFDPGNTANTMEYGEIQARIKIPGGSNSAAIWPAFWMLGDDLPTAQWPFAGEMDIMENKGSEPGTVFGTIHGPMSDGTDYNGGAGVGGSSTLSGGQSLFSSYHIFAVKWGPNSVSFSIDGTTYITLTPASIPSGSSWVFNGHPFFVILNVNEGGAFAPGTITTTQTMDVDYVRAYSFPPPASAYAAVGTASNPPLVSWNPVIGATSYEIWRNTTSDNTTATEIKTNATGTSYSDTSATRGTNYYYWIVAANASQISGFSAAILTRLTPTVTVASPPPDITYDGTTDVTNWVSAALNGVGGSPSPTGSATYVYYSGSTATGTPLASSPVNVGIYTVVANYTGDSNYVPAQSAPVTFNINNPAGISTSANAQYTISGPNGAQTLDVLTGIVTLSVDLSSMLPGYSLKIENGANVALAAGQNLNQLQLIGTGSVDVSGYSIILNYTAGNDPISTIQSELTTGYDGGSWTGGGIYSSMAATTNGYSLGYADGADNVVQNLPSGQIEITYALYGDVNLDGLVNATDFAIFGANFNTAATGWDRGDFTYDNLINATDFGLLGLNFGDAAVMPSVALPQSTQLTALNSDSISRAPTPTSAVLTSPQSDNSQLTVKKARSRSNASLNHSIAISTNIFSR